MTSSKPLHDRKTAQVCALAQQAIAAAISSCDNPLLLSLQVESVLPSPTVARLLVILKHESKDVAVDAVLDALDSIRGSLRSELALELNRKRAPELSFTVVPANVDIEAIFAPVEPEPHALEADPSGFTPSQRSIPLDVVNAEARRPKRETGRNLRRQLRREAKLRDRRARAAGREPEPNESLYETTLVDGAKPIRRWTRGVPVEAEALKQLTNIARLPIVYPWVAAMPDVHLGIGATVGSVIPTVDAIIPAAVGVDIGCGMMATRTTLVASDLPDALRSLRTSIERAVPHGRSRNGGRGDEGSWYGVPNAVGHAWKELESGFTRIAEKHPAIEKSNHAIHLGTLGTGNHFIELCLDEEQRVWVMLHSGSRGVGNRIGTYFIELAKRDMERQLGSLPDKDLAYFSEGSAHFDDYVEAVGWAQRFAATNRELMMAAVLRVLRESKELPSFQTDKHAINCHHNYVAREHHQGRDVYVTRKGAVRAGKDELGIIPGSMGARSYIVRGRGNPDSFCSCSHGAGRRMSRGEAKRRFTVEDHVRMTEGVECRKDSSVIDETPAAYKDIDAVMAAQADLVSIEHRLKQVLCVKG
jgi:tRNA-splicing ligase RtcB (3'-phosphate/5'-hydroxy nucleic acid ligase)